MKPVSCEAASYNRSGQLAWLTVLRAKWTWLTVLRAQWTWLTVLRAQWTWLIVFRGDLSIYTAEKKLAINDFC
jgi:hypothetical protein